MVIVHERPGTVNTPVGGVPVDRTKPADEPHATGAATDNDLTSNGPTPLREPRRTCRTHASPRI